MSGAEQAADETEARISRILAQKQRSILVSIDGRTTSGKTSLAEELERRIGCNVVHMDDFFLQPFQRTAERYAEPGGNVDYERVRREVLDPWKAGGFFAYAPYDAHDDTFGNLRTFPSKPVTIVEGSYSGHPALWDSFDLHVFLTTSREEQLRRVRRRNGSEAVGMFDRKWIPLEEAYFAECRIEERSDAVFRT